MFEYCEYTVSKMHWQYKVAKSASSSSTKKAI